MTDKERRFPIMHTVVGSPERRGPSKERGGGTIPWWVAEEAWLEYAKWGGDDQPLERVAERGGFGPGELDVFRPGWTEHWKGGKDEVPLEWRKFHWEKVWPKSRVPWPGE